MSKSCPRCPRCPRCRESPIFPMPCRPNDGESGCNDIDHLHVRNHLCIHNKSFIEARNLREIIVYNLNSLVSTVRKEIRQQIGLRYDESDEKVLKWIDRMITENMPTIPIVHTITDTSTLHVHVTYILDEWSQKLGSAIYSDPVQQQILRTTIQTFSARFMVHFFGPFL